MRTIFGVDPPTGAGPDANAQRPRLSARARALRRVYLQLFGIPDYESYVEHMASHHPGEPVMSRREFCAKAIDRKYGRNGKGPRCC